MKIDTRNMYRSNGLIDDIVLYGKPKDFLELAAFVRKAIDSSKPTLMLTESDISIEIVRDETKGELFTSLQNKTNEYFSMEDWNGRDVLRIYGREGILSLLQKFFIDLSGRGEGYSYISEYSKIKSYSYDSPEWRLHVEIT